FLITDSGLNIGFFFMLLAVLLYWFIMEKTRLGFGLRATGYNKDAARCSGINDTKNITLAMAISGMFAGLAGACVILGTVRYAKILTGQDGYGFMGIAVALVGNSKALGCLLAGYLFGVLKQAYSIMQGSGIPKEVVNIIQGLIVIFIAFRSGLSLVKDARSKAKVRKEAK
ncbi:MAG: ABC transporter permease, partial [Spirochaetales bacterium]|nr:ABC transporter permease [Candidatus Physcosoma equi]